MKITTAIAICLIPTLVWAQMSRLAPPTWTIPHLASVSASFKTELVLENHSSQEKEFYVALRDNEGAHIADFTWILEQGKREVIPIAQEQLDLGASWATVRLNSGYANDSQNVGVQYTPVTNSEQVSYVAAIQDDRRSHSWRVHAGDWQQSFDGVAIVKTECYPATVVLSQFDTTGQKVATHTLENTFQERYLVDLSALFTPMAGSYVEIRSEILLAVIGLKASRDQSPPEAFMIGNQANPNLPHDVLRERLFLNLKKWYQSGIHN